MLRSYLVLVQTVILTFVTLFLLNNTAKGQDMTLYLLSGHGSDSRIFNELEIPDHYEVKYIEYSVPQKNQSMASYALKLSEQIDESKPFVLMGVSLGGMLASEINDIKRAEQVILISSAKSSKELPRRYTFMQRFPIYKYLPPMFFKTGAQIAQPIVEPDRKSHKNTFVAMLKAKDPIFMKRAVHLIVTWDRKRYTDNIVHIHGTKDNTLPIRLIKEAIVLEKGSHMMALTRAEDLNKILKTVLN